MTLQVEASNMILHLQRHSSDQTLPPIVCVRFKGHSINCARAEEGNEAITSLHPPSFQEMIFLYLLSLQVLLVNA